MLFWKPKIYGDVEKDQHGRYHVVYRMPGGTAVAVSAPPGGYLTERSAVDAVKRLGRSRFMPRIDLKDTKTNH